MTRLGVLRAGYLSLGLAFAALTGSIAIGALLLLGFVIALVAGILFAFSDDDLPKWSGLALVAYFLLSVLAFMAATPITIERGGNYFVNAAPPRLASDVLQWMGLIAPLFFAAVAVGAMWEREPAPKWMAVGGLVGFFLFAVMSIALVPSGSDPSMAADSARAQGSILQGLFAVSAAVLTVSLVWATARPDSW